MIPVDQSTKVPLAGLCHDSTPTAAKLPGAEARRLLLLSCLVQKPDAYALLSALLHHAISRVPPPTAPTGLGGARAARLAACVLPHCRGVLRTTHPAHRACQGRVSR